MKRIGLVAKELGVSVRTLVRLEKSGEAFTPRRDRRGARVFDDVEVERLRAILYPSAEAIRTER